MTTTPYTPLIFGKLLELRRRLGGLQAKRLKPTQESPKVPAFPVKSSKELMEKLRHAVDELELIVSVHEVRLHPVQTEGGTCCYVTSTIRVEAADGSFRDFRGAGAGIDRDDKAAGKASTYAWKDALLKGLSIPDKEMVDADDEEGAGKEVKIGAPRRSAAGAGSDVEASAARSIASAKSVTQLEGLKGLLSRLPEEVQQRLSPAYAAKRAELGAQ